ncbi:uncharacterized protein RHIMIDRAFT_236053 [Rhizopus microsporus ATCC 52813]|uniref:Uncharacterized protein n=1 Tax=Rhizopus microsporus ATCC 52813 TaxID=1340429 RepID=A0A2G4SZ63_RHIZD|nr:uncharacterized protein RHIMIDRAFT_236053 [Rhizopus microsporus ATCC 52813]PHZ14062.1 hypothetical protein RHIMIDRAFT_236053 [Rhizopus microsporus ATCC 52813]
MVDSNSTSFGSVLASGIQDVAAMAALFGTDICDTSAGLALTRGYLFPAACSMSMFGVLGLAKHIIKSFLPLRIAKNLGIEVEKLDTYGIDKAIHGVASKLSSHSKTRLNAQNVRICIRVPDYNRSIWMGAFVSCFLLSCFNFIPYVPHYRTFYSNFEDPLNSSDPHIYFPLLLTCSSFVASFVCWFEAAIMLSGSPSLYTLAALDMDVFVPYYFGSLLARRIGYAIGLLSAVGIVIGYIGSYLVVQKMTPTDTYYWLGLQLALCFLRLVIWSWSAEKDDLNVIYLRYKIDRSDEGVIRQIERLLHTRKEAEDATSKLKTGGYFIRSEIVDAYYQAKYHFHDVFIPGFNDVNIQAFLRPLEKTKRATYYIMWNDKLHRIEKVLAMFENIALIMEVAVTEVGSLLQPIKHRVVRYAQVAFKNSYYHEESDLEAIAEEQIDANTLAKLKSKVDVINPWIKLVTSRRQVDLELEKDEQPFQTIELKSF